MLISLALFATAPGQVLVYEGTVFPEEDGWEQRPAEAPPGDEALENGWFVQRLRLPEGWPGPTGEGVFYRQEMSHFLGVDRFFVEWRAITDNPPWLIELWQAPTVVSAAGRAASLYHTVMTESAAVLLRDIKIPRVIAPISIENPHSYRVEVFPDEYIWYIDGAVADSGVPEGLYPDANAFLIWGARREYVDATTAWDFVRAGRIPEDASGDFDSDGFVGLFDFYFAQECLANERLGINGGPENDAGPGCRFADFDADADTDLLDFAEFQIMFDGTHP